MSSCERVPALPTTRLCAVGALLRGALLVLGASAPALAQSGPVRGGQLPGPLPLFPPDNWWNVDVRNAPVDPDSGAFLDFIGRDHGMHPDFGGDASPVTPAIYGMVYITVPGNQALVPVAFDYDDESDVGAPGRPPGYPIPAEAKTQAKWIEGGFAGNSGASGDKHMLIVDRDNRLLFETWNTRCLPQGSASCTWAAGSGAVFPLDSNARRPEGWTSADAAGLAVLPGLVRWDEAYGTEPIRHAIRFTVRDTNGHVYPASHTAGSREGAPPLGARLRLKPGVNPTLPPGTSATDAAAVGRIVEAMKTYGLLLADNGTDMYFQGTYDTRWNNSVLNDAFGSLVAGDFEVLQLGWRPPGMSLYVTTPCRAVNTRSGTPSPLGPMETRTFSLSSTGCGIAATAGALLLNVTAVEGASGGYLTVFPSNRPRGATSTLNYGVSEPRANGSLVGCGPGAAISVFNGSAGAVHVLVDVAGWFE